MSETSAIILIVIGAGVLLLKGILNIGNNFGKSKRFINRVGSGPARIIYGVIGIGLAVVGIIGWMNPNMFK